MKEKLIKFLTDNIDYELDIEKILEKPKEESHGDFALPMFVLSKEIKRNPAEIAKEIEEKLNANKPDFIEKIEAVGPYLNFFFDKKLEASQVINSILTGEFFQMGSPEPSEIVIEWPSPNTNKPLHLGHLRNILLGKSLTKILEKKGHKVDRVNLYNDRGIAICKSMLMYNKYGENKTPQDEERKPDHFVGDFYTLFDVKSSEDESLENEARDMLKNWENGDEETFNLWNIMNNWAYEGFKETFDRLGLQEFNKIYYESDIYGEGKKIIEDEYRGGLFNEDDKGNVVCDLSQEGYGEKVLLRNDGTSVYMTQDIALAYRKAGDFPEADKYVFLVANDQQYHFEVLFNILEKLGVGSVDKFYHFAYGYLFGPEGKMSSRKGNVVFADSLLEEVISTAKNNLEVRNPNLSQEELNRRAEVIGKAAISFYILRFNPLSDMTFSMEDALSFEGESGPYLLYTYARINSVLEKGSYQKASSINPEKLEEGEFSIIKTLKEYNHIVEEASNKYKPSLIANYLLRLAQDFNEYYHNYRICGVGGEKEVARLTISDAVANVLEDGLNLLGIDVMEEM